MSYTRGGLFQWVKTSIGLSIFAAMLSLPFMVQASAYQFDTVVSTDREGAAPGQRMVVNTKIVNTGVEVHSPVIDVEIYDFSGNKVFQHVQTVEGLFSPGEKEFFQFEWAAQGSGEYHVKVGIFTNDWSELLYWNDNALSSIQIRSINDRYGEVELVDTSFTPASEGQPGTLTAEFQTQRTPSRLFIIDLELHNVHTGEKVAQHVYNAQITTGTSIIRQLEIPQNLPTGEYVFKVGIFKPQWAQVISWNNEAEVFTVEREGSEAEVVLVHSEANSPTIQYGESTSIWGTFDSNITTRVLLDFELFNEDGRQVAQQFYDDVFIDADSEYRQRMITPFNLPPGTYTLQIGIFEPGWEELIGWYGDTSTVTVTR